MSTKVTTREDHGIESLTLDLYHAARLYKARLEGRLSLRLEETCGIRIAPAQLGFLAALVCGETTSSGIARRLGVSRQAAHRQAGELVQAGYLTVRADPAQRNQSLIAFTEEGIALMATCRRLLAELDDTLGPDAAALRQAIGAMHAAFGD